MGLRFGQWLKNIDNHFKMGFLLEGVCTLTFSSFLPLKCLHTHVHPPTNYHNLIEKTTP